MLTRDIELEDAILDLIDNCVDGFIRTRGRHRPPFQVGVSLETDRFIIEDDCGGIDRRVAEKYAFRFGREADDARDGDIPTIGMYGIGMKRAIFKLGESGTVTTRTDQDSYQVVIPANWHSTRTWTFPVRAPSHPLARTGTRVEVTGLRPGVSLQFKQPAFVSRLKRHVWQFYSDFIQDGLRISIGGDSIEPRFLTLLYDDKGVKPFYFNGRHEDVDIELAVGLNGPPGSREELEDAAERFGSERRIDQAGWTIVCNGRPIVYADKTVVSGWGDGVPKFHDQFSVVSGVVQFTADTASLLPVTTTKRGVDMSSHLYLTVRSLMRESMKVFTTHTNRWKNHPRSDQALHYADAEYLKPRELFERMRSLQLRERRQPIRGKYYSPEQSSSPLPRPPGGSGELRRVSYSRPAGEIRQLARFLLGNESASPSEVGERSFDWALEAERSK